MLLRTIPEMIAARDGSLRPLGLVPTMGALHNGHLSLVRKALSDNKTVVVSIFINPTQFESESDLNSYPSDIARDISLLRQEGVGQIFMPEMQDIYPEGFDTSVDTGDIATRLEGKLRPGHFKGVSTVVTKLFNIVRPNKSYFGQKDAQQVQVIRRLNQDLNMGVELVVMPTIRESDGLAMSSRNSRLDPIERETAPIIYKALMSGLEMHMANIRDASSIRQSIEAHVRSAPMLKIDYISIADATTLEEVDYIDRQALLSIAVSIGHTRLIDNVMLEVT